MGRYYSLLRGTEHQKSRCSQHLWPEGKRNGDREWLNVQAERGEMIRTVFNPVDMGKASVSLGSRQREWITCGYFIALLYHSKVELPEKTMTRYRCVLLYC